MCSHQSREAFFYAVFTPFDRYAGTSTLRTFNSRRTRATTNRISS